jgi:hypothetical protein
LLPAESSVCRVGPVFKKQSAVKAWKEVGGTAPSFLNLFTGRKWVVSSTTRPLYPRG